jgi:iron complex outermembrane recepter protein
MQKSRMSALKAGVAPLVLGASLWAGGALAQGAAAAPTPGDVAASPPIVVTGSILRRLDTQTPAPVTTLSFSELEDRGVNTVAQGLQTLSANGSATLNEGWNNGGSATPGANAISLRGLTVQDTLTLFNGLRMAFYPKADDAHRNFVDLGTIPDVVVDRMEVLKDSASSTYGADAVAGVVNIIMKKEVKGLHLDISNGISARGDGAEKAVDFTAGFGDLREKGWNLYVAATYRKKDAIMAGSRDYPFNSGDTSGICDGAGHCLAQNAGGLQFGVSSNNVLNVGTTLAPLTAIALVNPTTGAVQRGGAYSLVNSGGCAAFGLPTVTLTPAQATANFNTTQCQQDLRKQYRTVRPETERYGFVAHGVAEVGDRAELTADVEYTHVSTLIQGSPLAYQGSTSASSDPSDPHTLTFVTLPAYVCAAGVGTIKGTGNTGIVSTGCNAANGTLNPNNPYAAGGYSAILRGLYDRPTETTVHTGELRGALGLHGTFGDDNQWDYQIDLTGSHIHMGILYQNFLIPQRIADVVANGSYNFVSPWLNSEAVRDYIAPQTYNVSTSDLWQAQASLQRRLFALPGGMAQIAAGASWRHEAVNDPSANPANPTNPYERYYGISAVSAVGSRDVASGFFALSLPLARGLELGASGRYDSYSSGQSNFSPKLEAKYAPLRQLTFRGTWSKGFRIPSFNETGGNPATSYVASTVNCTTYAAFCAAHPGSTYATGAFALARTQYANADLKPEHSTSWTLGTVFQPDRRFALTLDYYKITVKDVIAGISAAAQAAALDAYLRNGTTSGVVPGVTIVPGAADPLNPAAQALPSTIQFQFSNQGKQVVEGIDLGARASFDLGGLRFNSDFDGSYLIRYELTTSTGAIQRYDGTLSPCDYASCSGSPKWRFTWANTISRGKVSLTATTYFTSGYDLAEVDYGDVAGTCTAGSAATGILYYAGTTTPVACRAKATWDLDLAGKVKVNNNFTVYANILNVLDIKPSFDPSAAGGVAGGGYNFNPAWGMANIIGRYFRIGAKVDF